MYADIDINYDVLNSLPTNDLLPFHVEHVQSHTDDDDVLTSQYDLTSSTTSSVHQQPPPDAEITFQKVVISNINGHVSSNELRAAALLLEADHPYMRPIPHQTLFVIHTV